MIKKLLVFLAVSTLFLNPGTIFAQDKRIEVNLSTQTLQAFDGSSLIYNFPISSGKFYPTPTGTFYIYSKVLSTRMVGGNPAIGTFYDLANVPYVMYFYQGFALHGTYWHHNFGHPMSHGCINLPTPDAQALYYWTDNTTSIHIYGQTPLY